MLSDKPQPKILLIHDDPGIRHSLTVFLLLQEYRVLNATTGTEGLRAFFATQPDLILLSPVLSDFAGGEFCQRIHRCTDIPVLFLGEQGSDFWRQQLQHRMIHPDPVPHTAPLTGRLLTVLPELQLCSHTFAQTAETTTAAKVTVDPAQYQVIHNQKKTKLTVIEYRLLQFLMQNQGIVLTVNQILEGVWRKDSPKFVPYVHNYIWRLRKKIESDPHHPEYIQGEYGVGYRFVN